MTGLPWEADALCVNVLASVEIGLYPFPFPPVSLCLLFLPSVPSPLSALSRALLKSEADFTFWLLQPELPLGRNSNLASVSGSTSIRFVTWSGHLISLLIWFSSSPNWGDNWSDLREWFTEHCECSTVLGTQRHLISSNSYLTLPFLSPVFIPSFLTGLWTTNCYTETWHYY